MMISMHNVTMEYPIPKRYVEILRQPFTPRRRVPALCNIDLQVGAGQRLAVVGPNGAGKTTLLKLIGGLLYPTQGEVLIDGRSTIRHNRHARERIGFVINEERSFYWRLTGTQNLQFFGTLEELRPDVLARRIEELLALVGLEEAGDKRVSDYSSGMRQRLAIARGLLADPDILLLDEPTRSLDPLGAVALRGLIGGEVHAARERTLIVTTNNVEDVTSLCDQMVVVHDQGIAASHPIDDEDVVAINQIYRASLERPQ